MRTPSAPLRDVSPGTKVCALGCSDNSHAGRLQLHHRRPPSPPLRTGPILWSCRAGCIPRRTAPAVDDTLQAIADMLWPRARWTAPRALPQASCSMLTIAETMGQPHHPTRSALKPHVRQRGTAFSVFVSEMAVVGVLRRHACNGFDHIWRTHAHSPKYEKDAGLPRLRRCWRCAATPSAATRSAATPPS